MYRTNDPRFRRRLNEIGQTLESANETAQSSIYIFGQSYIKPCFQSIGSCLGSCYEASCPGLHLTQRDRLRGRRRGRAELNFDFYDDWDEDEGDGLLGGWGNDEFDRLTGGNYGTVSSTPPRRERGMTYGSGKRGRRKSSVGEDPTVIPGSSKGGLLGRLFGGKPLRYKPSAAGLQEHPGRRADLTEGEALLEEQGIEGRKSRHPRARSGTVESRDTSDSYSSRGDIFPSDEEDDAIPLDDEFAMVLERRNTNGQSGPETESTSTGSRERRRGKRPSASSRTSTRRTVSTRSTNSVKKNRSRASSGAAPAEQETIPSLTELKQEEQRIEQLEEADVERRRLEAQRLATGRGLTKDASKEATPRNSSPVIAPVEPSQLPTPLDTEDEEDIPQQPPETKDDTPGTKEGPGS